MRRRLLNLLTALSLLLCVAVVALWVRSYWAHDVLKNTRWSDGAGEAEVRELYLISNGGAVDLFGSTVGGLGEEIRAEAEELAGWGFRSSPRDPEADNRTWRQRYWPYRWKSDRVSAASTYRIRVLHVPYWPIALVFLIAPAVRVTRALRKRRRESRGLCPSCGYDLRATPGRCPECGTSAVNWQI